MAATRKLVITGAQGFVAGSVIAQAGSDWEVHALSRKDALAERTGLYWYTLTNPSDPARLRRLLQDIRPHAVIHAAAMGDIDYCEAHRDIALDVNVGFTRTLAELADATGAKLVFCSTDNVFDGEHAPYREEDPPRPVNYYGETKAAAEQVVLESATSAVVARLSLVMGFPVLGAGNSFLSRMVAAFEKGRVIGVPPDEVRTPIDIVTVGRALLELAAGTHSGIFHLAGNDRLSRLEMVRRIAARCGYSSDLVEPNDPTGIPGRAERPRDASLDNRKAHAELTTPMCGLEDGLTLTLGAKKSDPYQAK